MAAVNSRRVWIGALAGGVVWNLWSFVIYGILLMSRYDAEVQAGHFLKDPRYPFYMGQWIITLFLLSYVVAWLYASARATLGVGPGTALKIGLLVGFVAGFPGALATSNWAPYTRMIPLGQMLEMWVGAILATLVAGWLYRD